MENGPEKDLKIMNKCHFVPNIYCIKLTNVFKCKTQNNF